MRILRVAATSKATSLAGAIAWGIREKEEIEMVAIGPEAVNQATKAVAIARTYLDQEGRDLVMIPEFDTVSTARDGERTALRLRIEARDREAAKEGRESGSL